MTNTHPQVEGRMVADRFRRIWHIVQHIADQPGASRGDLAHTFNLSERQVQADLNIIRTDMRLPLIRRRGYRFADEAGSTTAHGCLDINDVLALVTVMAVARQAVGLDVSDTLAEKLTRLVPLHLRGLAHELFLGHHRAMLRDIAESVLSTGERSTNVLVRRHTGQMDIVKPELIVPYRGYWWIVGEIAGTRYSRMWRLDQVATVEPVSVRVERKTRGAARWQLTPTAPRWRSATSSATSPPST